MDEAASGPTVVRSVIVWSLVAVQPDTLYPALYR